MAIYDFNKPGGLLNINPNDTGSLGINISPINEQKKLEEEQRARAEKSMKLKNFADTLRMVNANQSGNSQQSMMFANRLAQRKAEQEARQKEAQALMKKEQFERDKELFIKQNPELAGAIRMNQLFDMDMPKPAKLEYFSVSDADGKRVENVVNPTVDDITRFNKDNLFLNKLAVPSDRGKGTQDDSIYTGLKGQFKATNNLISSLNNMSKQFAENPKSALAVGGGVKFIDNLIQNIDATGSMLSGDNYKTMQEKGFTSNNGTDYSSTLKEVSVNTGISQSRIRDLAYLFAAARGQEGRGLSDKDYENALLIVSGGAGAEGKIAVLKDVAERMYGEAIGALDFEIDNLPLDANTDRFERLRGSLGVYKSPYSNAPASVGKYQIEVVNQ